MDTEITNDRSPSHRAGSEVAAANVRRLLVARALRAFGDGFVSLLLPLYLLELGFTPLEVGVIATATLLGSGLLALAVGLTAHRFAYRAMLLAATALMAATGAGFALITAFWPLLVIAVVGTLNPSSGDVSVFLPLEHAVLSRLVDDRGRTAAFARYSLVGALGAAVGSLAAGLPALLQRFAGLAAQASFQWMFVAYAALGLASALAYRGLPKALESQAALPHAALGPSRRRIYGLAALFSLDAFGGGFVVQSMVALWLYQRSISRARRRATSSSGPACSRRCRLSPRHDWPGASAWSTRWCSRTCPPTSACWPSPSCRASRAWWPCSSCAARSRRWTCRRAART